MEPVRFVFGLHLHQPVGSFDHVVARHVAEVYRPLLHHLAGREFFPLVLHLSGPLLEWLETHDRSYLDHLGRLVADELRKGRALGYEIVDFDGDGHDEVWVHSRAFSAVLSPRRGAALEELTAFQRGVNYADTLTRRREAYHDDNPAAGIDTDERAIFVDRILPSGVELEGYRRGDYQPVVSWSRVPFGLEVMRRKGAVEVVCRARAGGAELVKRYRFEVTGAVRVTWRWDPSKAAPDDRFTTELSLAAPLGLDWEVEPEMWRFPIETVSHRERGFDRARQGDSLTLRWPAAAGTAWIELRP